MENAKDMNSTHFKMRDVTKNVRYMKYTINKRKYVGMKIALELLHIGTIQKKYVRNARCQPLSLTLLQRLVNPVQALRPSGTLL